MTFRKVLFWCHLTAGLVAGVVIFIMSVTGALLAYQKQITEWADTRNYQTNVIAGARRLPVDTLIASVQELDPSVTPTGITIKSDVRAPAAIGVAAQRTIYVNPYTGVVMGEGSPAVRRFFRVVTDWHRTLAFTEERRTMGRAITGACNLAFLLLVCSGFYLWWPRTLTFRQIRNVMAFNGSLRGKARDFNWHNVIGFWCAVPLFFIVLGSVVISYPWASAMVYRVVGEEPPAPARPAGTGNTANTAREGGRQQAVAIEYDTVFARAGQQVPDWRSINMRLPATAEAVVFMIDEGTGGQPQKRSTLTLNPSTAALVKWEPFESMSPGRRLRSWLRFVHTGEFYGLLGQAIAGLASLGGAFLVYTGVALAFRRFLAWRLRPRATRRANVPVTAVTSVKYPPLNVTAYGSTEVE